MEYRTDAFGNALMDCFSGNTHHYVIERDDGYLDVGNLDRYFASYADWGDVEKRMPEFVGGRVLDVGCGAGRHALHLQDLGYEVVGIDASSGAIEISRRRGVKRAIAVSVDDLATSAPELTGFGTIIMMGHNVGLLHGLEEGRRILSHFAKITSPDARIVGVTRDVGETSNPYHLAYQEANLKKGRMRGQIRFRIRYGIFAGAWMDYLFLSEDDFRFLARGTGWRLEHTAYGNGGFGGTSYLAVLSKE